MGVCVFMTLNRNFRQSLFSAAFSFLGGSSSGSSVMKETRHMRMSDVPESIRNLFEQLLRGAFLILRYQICSLFPGNEIGHIVIATNGAYVPTLYQLHHLVEPFFGLHWRSERIEARSVSLEKNVIAN
jgi:hypothetical protein